MRKRPCYTCGDKFVSGKLTFLLQNKINEAKEFARKEHYTGAMAIVALESGNGFAYFKEEELKERARVRQYLLFDSGNSIE